MKKVSIKDVAREAGVSITTVSRALNGYSDVSEKTKEKIQEVVAQLNYAPDVSARALGGKADTTIALLVSDLLPTNESGFVYGLISGLFYQCNKLGCEFVLLITDNMKQQKMSFLQLCKRKNLSGVVVSGLKKDDHYYHEIINTDIPCAIIDMETYGKNKCEITINNLQASQEAVEYLINLGHEKIGMLAGSQEAEVSGERYMGYEQSLKKAGISIVPKYIRHCDFREDKAYEATKDLLKKFPEITALFCASDLMAIGAIRGIMDMGKRVPDDISIIGFDDIPLAPYFSNGITTIRQSPQQMGQEGGQAVWNMIQGEVIDKKIILSHELIIRGTTQKIN